MTDSAIKEATVCVDWKIASDEEVNREAKTRSKEFNVGYKRSLPGLASCVETPLTAEQVVKGGRESRLPPLEFKIDFEPVKPFVKMYEKRLEEARLQFWADIESYTRPANIVALYELVYPANRVEVALYALLGPEKAKTEKNRQWLIDCDELAHRCN